jgi:hypothetical protein
MSDEASDEELLVSVEEALPLGVLVEVAPVEALPVEVLPEDVLPVEALPEEAVSDAPSDGASKELSVDERSDFEPLPSATDEVDGVLDGVLSFALSLQATRTVNKRHIIIKSAISFFIKVLLMYCFDVYSISRLTLPHQSIISLMVGSLSAVDSVEEASELPTTVEITPPPEASVPLVVLGSAVLSPQATVKVKTRQIANKQTMIFFIIQTSLFGTVGTSFNL